jgi:hypothetical protein
LAVLTSPVSSRASHVVLFAIVLIVLIIVWGKDKKKNRNFQILRHKSEK